MTITCGCAMVEGLARTDRQIGSVSPWTSYVGNAFKGANMGLMAGASFVNVPYGAEVLAAELAPAGLIVNVGNTYVRGETLITAAMNAATFTNMMLACNETHAYASGENALSELMGQDTYELVRDAASAGSSMTLMAAMCNPRMYGYGSETNNIRQMAGYDNGESDPTYIAPSGGGGITSIIKINGQTVSFGHGGRHLEGTGLNVNTVNQALANEISTLNISIGGARI